MFGIKDLIKKAVQPSVKVVANNNFINSINSIKETAVKQRDEDRKGESDNLLHEAKILIEKCSAENGFTKEKLKEISDKLILSIQNNRNNAESYLNLARILYIAGNSRAAIKYLKIARELSPKLEGINQLVQVITSESAASNKSPNIKLENIQNIQNKTDIQRPQRTLVKRIQSNSGIK